MADFNVFGNRSNFSDYQRARADELQSADRSYRGGSFDGSWKQQYGNANAFTGNDNANIHQGHDRDSANATVANHAGHGNTVQHGNANASNNTGTPSKSYFNWQGAGNDSSNTTRSNAEKFISWQRGQNNFADGSESGHSDLWQGGYNNDTTNIAMGGKDGGRIKQVAAKNGFNAAYGGGNKADIEQSGTCGTQNYALGSEHCDKITQTARNGKNSVESGAGNDVITLNGDNNQTDVTAGKGNDTVTVNGDRNRGTINGNCGDDKFVINGKNNNLTIDGGSGNNTGYINGNQDDYNVTRGQNGEWNLTSKNDPNSKMTFKNINDLQFRGANGEYQSYQQPQAQHDHASHNGAGFANSFLDDLFKTQSGTSPVPSKPGCGCSGNSGASTPASGNHSGHTSPVSHTGNNSNSNINNLLSSLFGNGQNNSFFSNLLAGFLFRNLFSNLFNA